MLVANRQLDVSAQVLDEEDALLHVGGWVVPVFHDPSR